MNNELVALVNSMCNDCIDWKIDPMSIDGQPLYTHPAKTLTDEEKIHFGMLFINWNRSLKEPLVKPAYELYVFDQALAILRKAQEK
jgi:hypothetical protein